jgi:hypothetical protein
MSIQIPVVKSLEKENDNLSKKWEVWKWDESNSLSLIAELDTLDEVKVYVELEIKRIHPETGEDTVSIDCFKRDVPQNATTEQAHMHIIYKLPVESDAPNKLKLMRTCGRELVSGLTAYRYKKNPNVEYS